MDKVTGQCPQTTTFLKRKGAEAVSNRGPSAYQPNALPLGQTGSQTGCDLDHIALRPQKRGCLLGTEGGRGRGRESEGSTADTARKRPERPWTAARTMEVLRRCPLAIAQRLVHCCFNRRVTRTMSVALLLTNNPKRKKSSFRSPAPPPCS